MSFKPIFQPYDAMPKTLLGQGSAGLGIVLRDQLTLSSWLLVGASIHGLVTVLLPKSAIYLSACLFTLLAYRFGHTLLEVYGFLPRSAMDGIIPGRVSAQIPDMNGNMPSEPSKEGIVVMFLGFKSNHPLGMLAPGFKDVGKYFGDMHNSLDTPEGREEFGFLGISTYVGNRCASSNELMTISHWRNIEGVHAFAESRVHRVAWDWWNRTVKEHPHLSISHEIYRSEPGSHENVYINARPTLIGGTAFRVKSEDGKQEQKWINPLVDAKKGVLTTSNGRLGRRGGQH